MEGKGRTCLNKDGIIDFRRCELNNSFCVTPGEEYIDRYGVMKYNEPEYESSDIISIKKISNTNKIDSINDIISVSTTKNNGFGSKK